MTNLGFGIDIKKTPQVMRQQGTGNVDLAKDNPTIANENQTIKLII
jgi:hypothetical protein